MRYYMLKGPLKLIIFIGVYLCSNVSCFSLSNNSYENFRYVESLYKLGEYEDCESIGDSIEDILNVYDARISAYSALASYRIALSYKDVPTNEILDRSEFIRRHLEHSKFKAKYALEYYDEIFSDFGENAKKESKNSDVTEHLTDMDLALKCCNIIKPERTIDYLKSLNSYLALLPRKIVANDICITLEKQYCDIAISLLQKKYNSIDNDLLKDFEDSILKIPQDNQAVQLRAANIYAKLSDAFQIAAMEYRHDDVSPIGEIALNTMIHSRDYSLYAKKRNGKGSFLFHSWKEIQCSMKKNSVSIVYFTYFQGSDSWNYAWRFTDTDIVPKIKYAGHSYWRISLEALDNALIDDKETVFNAYYYAGTDDMSLLNLYSLNDLSINTKIVRLYSISEIVNLKEKYDKKGQVVAFANLDYSKEQIQNRSDEKGLAKRFGKFASATREIDALKTIFGTKLITYQAGEATKDKFMSLNSQTRILHVSTHGFFDKKMLKDLNRINPNVDATGDNVFRSCGLALSGYNDDKTMYLSAYDVINQNFNDIDIVFLSACESGIGKVLYGGDYSLASAFKIAGVKNVVAILSPINEKVATDFAGKFYELVYSGMSYHDAFYETKQFIKNGDSSIVLIQ